MRRSILFGLILLMVTVKFYGEVYSGVETMFYFYHSDIDWQYCEDEMYVDLWIQTEDGVEYYEMNYDAVQDRFYVPVAILDHWDYIEYGFKVCDTFIPDMREYNGYCEPAPDHYTVDDYGDFNALVIVDPYEADYRAVEFTLPAERRCPDGADLNVISQGFEEMDYYQSTTQYRATFTSYGKAIEFYFYYCDQYTMYKDDYANVTPYPMFFCDDGYDGFNGLIILDEEYMY